MSANDHLGAVADFQDVDLLPASNFVACYPYGCFGEAHLDGCPFAELVNAKIPKT